MSVSLLSLLYFKYPNFHASNKLNEMDKYDTEKEMIGQGTFGTVYRVRNLNDKKYYAMKLIYIGKERFK